MRTRITSFYYEIKDESGKVLEASVTYRMSLSIFLRKIKDRVKKSYSNEKCTVYYECIPQDCNIRELANL